MRTNNLLLLMLMFSVLFMGPIAKQMNSDLLVTAHESADDHDDDSSDDDDGSDDDGNDENGDDDNDGIEDDKESAFERNVETEESPTSWKIKSELKNGDNKDKFEVEFKTDGEEPEIEFEYSTETDTTEIELEYEVEFDKIIEFSDDGSLLGYDENDTVVSTYELDKVEWNDIAYTSEVVDTIQIFTATGSTVDGVFSIVLRLSAGIIALNSSLLTPNAIKFDIIIDSFPYEGENTMLALQTDVKTSFEQEFEEESEDEIQGFASDESQIAIASNATSGFFSWLKTAEADGLVIDVISSEIFDGHDDDLEDGESQSVIYFTFNATNPKVIIWDPKVGVVSIATAELYQELIASGFSLPGFGIWIAVFSMIGMATFLRKKYN